MRIAPLPYPADVDTRQRHLSFSQLPQPVFTKANTIRLKKAVDRCLKRLANYQRIDALTTDIAAEHTTLHVAETSTTLKIHCSSLLGDWPTLGADESYLLVIDQKGVLIKSKTEWGILHGLETLAQIARPQAEGGWLVLETTIKDKPAYPWRGLSLDVCRHWLGLEAIKKVLDGMAASHLNVLHLHLSDDQAFRLKIKSFPGSLYTYDDHGFSEADIKILVNHAADRGIRVVPEIDAPGHCTALLAGHPTLGQGNYEPSTQFGGHTACLDPSRENTYSVFQNLFAHLGRLFPDNFVHMGSDEVCVATWEKSGNIQAFMKQMSIANTDDLLAYFNKRISGLLRTIDKSMVVWDEALHKDLPKDVVVQCWRGASAREWALLGQHRVVFSSGYYLDLGCAAGTHYQFDPGAKREALQVAEDAWMQSDDMRHVKEAAWQVQARAGNMQKQPIKSGNVSRILGGEACLWSELVDEDCLDTRLFSRLPAIAERLWLGSQAAGFPEESLYDRLQAHWTYLENSTNLRPVSSASQRLLSFGLSRETVNACSQLLAWVEPVKWYRRVLGDEAIRAISKGKENRCPRPYDVHTALDRMVDLCPPESLCKYDLEELIDQIIANPNCQKTGRLLELLAKKWQQPLPILRKTTSGKVREIFQLGHWLHRCSTLLVSWLEMLAAGQTPARTQRYYKEELNRMAMPIGEMTLVVIPPLHRLLDACYKPRLRRAKSERS